MENHCKHVTVLLLFSCLILTKCVSEEVSAESVYKLLSHSIFEIKIEMENMNRRIENVEEKIQGITTTVSPLVESTIKEDEFLDFKEQLDLKALAIKKTLSNEKLLLRKAVDNFELVFAEFKSEIQNDIASINASLQGKADEMLNIADNSSNALAKGMAELTSDLNITTNNISQFLETMELTMTSNFENIETRMITNVTYFQNETQEIVRSLQKDLGSLSKNVSSISSSLSNRISSETSSLSSKISLEASSLSSRISSLDSSLSSISSSLSNRISSETSSLSSRISSVSSSLSSTSSSLSSLSSRISSLDSSLSSRISSVSSSLSSTSSSLSSSISSLSSRISVQEGMKIAFTAHMIEADSYYNPSERINDFRNVILNQGDCYDGYSGYFTAPRSGTYLFSVTISSTDNELVIVYIMDDGIVAGIAMAGDESHATGSVTILRYLFTGNKVWVQTSSDGGKKYIRSNLSFFSGVLIE